MNYVYLISASYTPWQKTEPRKDDLCVVIASSPIRAKAIAFQKSQRARDYDYIDLRAKRVEPLHYLEEAVTMDEEGWQWDFEDPEAEAADLRRWLFYQ